MQIAKSFAKKQPNKQTNIKIEITINARAKKVLFKKQQDIGLTDSTHVGYNQLDNLYHLKSYTQHCAFCLWLHRHPVILKLKIKTRTILVYMILNGKGDLSGLHGTVVFPLLFPFFLASQSPL